MVFNGSKFECVKFGRNNTVDLKYMTSNNSLIPNIDHVCDLGVTMSKDCTFQTHIAKTITQCNQMSGWILRTFSSRDRNVLIPVFKQLVMSRAEYCTILWSPTSAGLISQLETIQRSFTRRLSEFQGIGRPNYWERLSKLNLYSLQRRRERYIIIYAWKVIQGLVPNPGLEPMHNSRTGTHLRIPNINSASPSWVKTLRRGSFTFRGSQLFNCLPIQLRQIDPSQSLLSFKSTLDKLLATIPDQPTVTGLNRAAESNSLIHQMQYKS